MNIIAIDPGANGAAAIDYTVYSDIHFILSFNFKNEIENFMRAISLLKEEDVETVIYFEKVHAIFSSSAKSTFSFGFNNGYIQGILRAKGFENIKFVCPTKWQTEMNCRTHGDKNITKELAQKLNPGIKVTHANADALLILEYAKKMEGEIDV